MRGAGCLMVGLILGLGAAEATGYTIIRKDGTRFEVPKAPVYEDGQATFEMAGGSRGSIAEDAVDKAATERANQPSDTPEVGGGGSVFTNEALVPSAEENVSAAFTNEDLEGAWGRATEEEAMPAESDAELVGPGARIREIEERVAELKRQLAEVGPGYVDVSGDRVVDPGAVVAEQRRIAAELTEAERDLAEARGKRARKRRR